MNVLSLFDGMSCGQIALERAGIPVTNYYASEIDKYAIKVTQVNYPNTIQLGCITKHDEWELPKIDLVMGGSPCQGFSFAGKQLNFDDPRSKLFFEFVEAMNRVKPKYFLLENVKMKKEYQNIISKMLSVEPIEINSALVSAQNRRRLYWTNISDIEQPKDKRILLKDIIEQKHIEGHTLSDKAINRINRKSYSKPKVMPDKTGTLNTKNNSGQLSVDSGTTLIPLRVANIGGGGQGNRVYSIAGKSCCLSSQSGGRAGGSSNLIFDSESELRYRKLTPVECERLQTVPDNYTNHVSNTQRYKILGNGWTVDVIAHIFKGLE